MMKDMRRIAFGLTFIGIAAAAPFTAFAASLYFSPANKTVAVGDNFTVAVDVSSADQAMNAASGDISFPTSKLRVLSVSNTGSAMNLWVQNPSFSNAASGGDINFAGVVLNPGFTGTAGNVITIRFQAVAAGTASLSFSAGSVLANDGNGTDILTSMGGGVITINPAVAAPPPAPSSVPAVLTQPTTTASETTPLIASSTTTPTTTPVVTVTTGEWADGAIAFLLSWGLVIALALLLLAALFAIAYYAIHRVRRFHLSLSRDLVRERKELRDDLKRIEKELEADRPSSKIDLSPTGMHKKQERVRSEIEHIEEDLKRDIKDNE